MIYFEDLEVDSSYFGDECLVDEEEMLAYARKNDPLPFHIDREVAKTSPFGGLVASGGFTITLGYRSAIGFFAEVALLAVLDSHIQWLHPVRPGNILRDKFTITGTRMSNKPVRGVVNLTLEILNQDHEMVLKSDAVWLVATRPVVSPAIDSAQ